MNTNASLNQKRTIGSILIKNNTYLMIIGLFIICAIISPDFFSADNLTNIGRQQAGNLVIAMGMLFVILTGGIDLSVGMVAACGSVMVAFAMTTHELGVAMSVILPLAFGCGLGLATGILVSYARMAPFIASLAMMTIAEGLSLLISNGQPVMLPKENAIGSMGTAAIGPMPVLLLLAIAVIVIFLVVEKYTSFGRIVRAIGSNETAVRLAGIPVRKYKMWVYAISGVCSGLAGVIAASRSNIGTPIIGGGWELDAIAACVIGGASLSGGEGSTIKTVVGVFVLALITNIMNLLAVPSYWQSVIKGLIIVGSVLLQTFTSERKSTSV